MYSSEESILRIQAFAWGTSRSPGLGEPAARAWLKSPYAPPLKQDASTWQSIDDKELQPGRVWERLKEALRFGCIVGSDARWC